MSDPSSDATVTFLDDDRVTDVTVLVVGERVLVAPDDLARATGWDLKPEGLCRGDVCVALRHAPDVVVDGRVDVARAGAQLGRTVVVDGQPDARVVAYGAGAPQLTATLQSCAAPDFTLPQIDGTPFTFGALGRKKKVLVAWASW